MTKTQNNELSQKRPTLLEQSDLKNLLALIAIAAVIGIYLIMTTVMICKDGTTYILQAQQFATNPQQAAQGYPFGYPLSIYLAKNLVDCFVSESSLQTWICTAQSLTLICRLLAIIPIYFIAKKLTCRKYAFLATGIMIFLPFPAAMASDALRDWPYIMFLATGFLILLNAAKSYKPTLFAAIGLIAGLGYAFRPECVQLVIFALVWLVMSLVKKSTQASKKRLALAMLLLIVCFAVPVAAYTKARGNLLPKKVQDLFSTNAGQFQQSPLSDQYSTAGLSDTPGASLKLFERVSENTYYFFTAAFFLGLFAFLKDKKNDPAYKFIISAFLGLNAFLMILLFCNYGYIGRRHSLSIVILTVFAIPIGNQIIAEFLGSFIPGKKATQKEVRRNFYMLIIIGIAICMPKILKPIGDEKVAHLEISNWLNENTNPSDVIAVDDKRITFYAERQAASIDRYRSKGRFKNRPQYLVIEIKPGQEPNLLKLNLTPKPIFSSTFDDDTYAVFKILPNTEQ